MPAQGWVTRWRPGHLPTLRYHRVGRRISTMLPSGPPQSRETPGRFGALPGPDSHQGRGVLGGSVYAGSRPGTAPNKILLAEFSKNRLCSRGRVVCARGARPCAHAARRSDSLQLRIRPPATLDLPPPPFFFPSENPPPPVTKHPRLRFLRVGGFVFATTRHARSAFGSADRALRHGFYCSS